MDKKICDICKEEIARAYAIIYGVPQPQPFLDIGSKECLKKFVDNGFKTR